MKLAKFLSGALLATLLMHPALATLELKKNEWPFVLPLTIDEFKQEIIANTMTYSSWPTAPYIQFQPTFAFLFYWYNRFFIKNKDIFTTNNITQDPTDFFRENSLSLTKENVSDLKNVDVSASKAANEAYPYVKNGILTIFKKKSEHNAQIYLNLVGLKVLYGDKTVMNNKDSYLPKSMWDLKFFDSVDLLFSCFDWSDNAYDLTSLTDIMLTETLFALVGVNTKQAFTDAIKTIKENAKKDTALLDNLALSLKTIANP